MKNIIILLFVAIVIGLITIFYFNELNNKNPHENFSELVKIFEDINENVDEFNKNTREANTKIENSVNSIQTKINQVAVNNMADLGGIKNSLQTYDNKISNLKNEFATNDVLQNYALTSTVKDMLLSKATMLQSTLASKEMVESEYVPYDLYNRNMADYNNRQNNQDMSISGIKDTISEIKDTMIQDYAGKDWSKAEFPALNDFNSVKTVQNDMLLNFAKKSDLNTATNSVKTSLNNVNKKVDDFSKHVENSYTTTDNIKNYMKQEYTTLDSHNAVSRTVNDALVTLNNALLKTIEYDGDAAMFAKLSMIESTLNNVKDDNEFMKQNTKGITENSIDRNELLLGKFLVSGVEPGENIKIFNRDKTSTSGGISLDNIDANNITARKASSFQGDIKVGTASNQPILINGYADVNINQGTINLNDNRANHKIAGHLQVDKINTSSLLLGKNLIDSQYISDLDKKIKNIEDKVDILTQKANNNNDVSAVYLYDKMNGQGNIQNIQDSVEEIDFPFSSIKLTTNVKITLYSESNFSGNDVLVLSNLFSTPKIFNMNDYKLDVTKSWDRLAKSIKIEKI